MSDAKDASNTLSTTCTRRLSITAVTAAKPNTSAANCGKLATDAGASTIAGGMSTSTAGTTSATGTTAITIAIEIGLAATPFQPRSGGM